MELWKKITELPNYEISSHGSIRHIRNKKLLKLYKNNYYQVSITVQGKSKAFKIHRLVAKAFLPNVENKPYVNHKDGSKLNNNLSNLEWCTAKENTFKNPLIFVKK